ncbi:MAG: LolA family protein [Tepidisphaeraceae bacterium]
MRLNVIVFVLAGIVLATGCAMAQAPDGAGAPAKSAPSSPTPRGAGPSTAAKAPDLSPASPVDDILDALDARGDDLRDFTADVRLTETDTSTADERTRTGQVWFQNLPDGGGRVRVTFDKLEEGERIKDDKIEYLLDGQWLTDRNYAKEQQVRRQVLRPGERINLLKLGEGPFPLPIGQDKSDVHNQFDVKKVDAAPAPAGTVRLQLIPRQETRLARRLATIDVWVDTQTHMPRRIEVLDPNQTTVRTTDLTHVKVNPGLSDPDFALPPIPERWTQLEEAFEP